MSDYRQAIDWLYNQLPAFEKQGIGGYKPGLDTARELDRLYGHPSRSFKAIHIAGTNGKGSTAHSLAAVLMAAGYRTGLYTSPHLVDFRERVRVDGKMVDADFVEAFIDDWRGRESTLRPTFFELTTEMAFEWFRRCNVEIAVIETGLGGRLDSTNIIEPILSIITNISLDHTDLLGNTLEQIASEKAGIIKPGAPVVIGEGGNDSVRNVFIHRAADCGSRLYFADESPVAAVADGLLQRYPSTCFGPIVADLCGQWQERNMATILCSLCRLRELGLGISDDDVRRGLSTVCASTGLLGRWTVIAENPLTVYDTGHNPAAWRLTANMMRGCVTGRRHLVLGFVADKDVAEVMRVVADVPDVVLYLTQPPGHRALPLTTLSRYASEAGMSEFGVYDNVMAAYEAAKKDAATDDLVFIGGSNYLVGEFLSLSRL